MDFGIKIDDKTKKVYCAACGAHVGNDGKAQMNFCPKCGMHLNMNAAKVYEDRVARGQLEILYNLLDQIQETGKDPKAKIEEFIKEFTENK